jgi:FkbM family methyltransferase
MVKGAIAIIKSINRHPLASRHKLKCYLKFLWWQIRSAIIKKPIEVAFTSKSKLLVKKGMAGATGNIYMGLHEFEDMALLLHYLQPDDLFFDIGANIGSYTVLAAAHCGAEVFAFEPVPETFQWLKRNIDLNKTSQKVTLFNNGVGDKSGKLYFTKDIDTINHVVVRADTADNNKLLEIDVLQIDELVLKSKCPSLIKIDVEGFETAVLAGMCETLKNSTLKIIIIELNGLSGRYNFSDDAIHAQLLAAGFLPYQYHPFNRALTPLNKYGSFNTIYIKDLHTVQQRLQTATAFTLLGDTI